MDLGSRRKLTDSRLFEVYAECPDEDGAILVPTGDMYSLDTATPPVGWVIGFRCPNRPDEVIEMWRPEFQPLIDEILDGIDIAELPIIGPRSL